MDRNRQLLTGSLLAIACTGAAWWCDQPTGPVATSSSAPDGATRTTVATGKFPPPVIPAPPQPLNLHGVEMQPLSRLEYAAVEPAAFPGWRDKSTQGNYPPSAATAPPSGPVTAPIVELPPEITGASSPTTNTFTNAEPQVLAGPQLNAPAITTITPTELPQPSAPQSESKQLNLPPQVTAPLRDEAYLAAVAQSQEMCREARRLAERGAIFSARKEFLAALRTLASARDHAAGGQTHVKSLAQALRAIEEANDFAADEDLTKLPALEHVSAGHRTQLLSKEELQSLSPWQARDRYLAFAIEQITRAVEAEPAAATACFGLGRVTAAESKQSGSHGLQSTTTPLVWYHATLNCDPRHFHAAHELGTLYARRGDWQAARTVLQRAVQLGSHPNTWRNLAAVHAKLGESAWAEAALARAGNQPANTKAAENLPDIQWVSPEAFAAGNTQSPTEVATNPSNTNNGPTVVQPNKQTTPDEADNRTAKKPTLGKWLPWLK